MKLTLKHRWIHPQISFIFLFTYLKNLTHSVILALAAHVCFTPSSVSFCVKCGFVVHDRDQGHAYHSARVSFLFHLWYTLARIILGAKTAGCFPETSAGNRLPFCSTTAWKDEAPRGRAILLPVLELTESLLSSGAL